MELILIPLLSAAVAYAVGNKLNRSLAFALSLIPGLVALALGVHSIDVPWFSDDIRLALNPSGWSNLMLLLTNFLVPVIVLAGWREVLPSSGAYLVYASCLERCIHGSRWFDILHFLGVGFDSHLFLGPTLQ
jgi:NADH:ubiquinone oxidoreductase subunit 4 (subunit M)